MHKIELIKGAAWDAPVMETHPVRGTIHLVDIEKTALALLDKAQSKPIVQRPTGYRIINPTGRVIKARNT